MTAARYAIVLFILVALGEGGAAQERAERAFPPPESEQEEKRAALRSLFAADYASQDTGALRKLAQKLRKRLPIVQYDAAAHYTTLCEIRDVSARAADALGALEAIRQLARRYEVYTDVLEEKAMETSARAVRTRDDAANVSRAFVLLARDAATRDDYEHCRSMLSRAAKGARKTRDPLLAAYIKKISSQLKDVERRLRDIDKAMKTLLGEPRDAAAGLEAGRFVALVKGDWTQGLRLLSNGADHPLCELARLDLETAEITRETSLALAEAWLEAAGDLRGSERTGALERSGAWFVRALRQASGLDRVPLVARLEEVVLRYASNPRLLHHGGPGTLRLARLPEELVHWNASSGDWRITGATLVSTGTEGGDRYLVTPDPAEWARVEFEFQGGNPGLYFAHSPESLPGHGVNLDSEEQYNGEIKRDIDMDRWNRVVVEFSATNARFFLNDEPVHTTFIDGPRYIVIKAHRGVLRVRKLAAAGLAP